MRPSERYCYSSSFGSFEVAADGEAGGAAVGGGADNEFFSVKVSNIGQRLRKLAALLPRQRQLSVRAGIVRAVRREKHRAHIPTKPDCR